MMFVAKRLDMRHNAISNILYVVVGYRQKTTTNNHKRYWDQESKPQPKINQRFVIVAVSRKVRASSVWYPRATISCVPLISSSAWILCAIWLGWLLSHHTVGMDRRTDGWLQVASGRQRPIESDWAAGQQCDVQCPLAEYHRKHQQKPLTDQTARS